VIYLSLGRREQGKTTLALYVVRHFPARVIFDPRGIIDTPDALIVRDAADLEFAMEELAARATSEVIYAPAENDLDEAFEAFALAVKQWVLDQSPRRHLAVLVDEASFVDLEIGAWQWVLRCAPRLTVHLALTVHRPVDVPVIVRTLADHWLVFRTREERDLRVVAERCGADVAALAAELPDRAFVRWDDQRARMEVVRESARWYVPLAITRNERRMISDARE
jgi:hypothetical protein